MSFALKTTAFTDGGGISKKYTCDGADVSPALNWNNAPEGTRSFALIADDPDAPVGTWTHWIIWNIPASSTALPESVPKVGDSNDGARQGRNDFKRIGYGGPLPPPGKPHRYFFKLYALDAKLDVQAGAAQERPGTRHERARAVTDRINGHVRAVTGGTAQPLSVLPWLNVFVPLACPAIDSVYGRSGCRGCAATGLGKQSPDDLSGHLAVRLHLTGTIVRITSADLRLPGQRSRVFCRPRLPVSA